MSTSRAATYLNGKSLAWSSGSLVAAGKLRVSTLPHHNQIVVLQVFVSGLRSRQTSSLSTACFPKHYSYRQKVQERSIIPKCHARFQSTETQRKSSLSSSPSSHSSSPPLVGSTTSTSSAQPNTKSSHVVTSEPASEKTAAAEDKAKGEKELESLKPKDPLHTRAWAKIKEEALHYWHGSKLLGKEVRISWRLLRRLMLGYSLTRREQRQLKRTMGDLLRLIPFIPFIIVPAGELLLPVAIKIFPNMLPSTFESKFALEEKRRGLIKVRLEMAKFLQGTIKEGGLQATDKVKTSDEFKEFFRKVRLRGESPSDEDIIKVAKLFEDDLTLDNLTRPQLVSMCRYMQINAFGTDNYLRYQIRHTLNGIRQDDIVISAEGVDSMSESELVSACQNRGIQTSNLSEERLRQELSQWIQLHLHQKVSGILLILSKAFNYVAQGSNDGAKSHLRSLELTLSSLPDNLLNETELQVNKDGATNKQRLEVLQQQEELIEDEAEQEEEEAAAREVERERRNAEKARLQQEEAEARALLPEQETEHSVQDARMTHEQLTELGEALSILSAKSSVMKEREELAQLIHEIDENEQQEAASTEGSEDNSSSRTSMSKRIRAMLEKIDAQLEEYDRDVGSRMHIIQASHTGKISVDDLGQALRLIKHKPDDELIEKLVDKLDVDHDGLVPLDDVIELARAETGLGILRDDNVRDIHAQGQAIRGSELKPKKSDILEE